VSANAKKEQLKLCELEVSEIESETLFVLPRIAEGIDEDFETAARRVVVSKIDISDIWRLIVGIRPCRCGEVISTITAVRLLIRLNTWSFKDTMLSTFDTLCDKERRIEITEVQFKQCMPGIRQEILQFRTTIGHTLLLYPHNEPIYSPYTPPPVLHLDTVKKAYWYLPSQNSL
jgi:hypothetical protein